MAAAITQEPGYAGDPKGEGDSFEAIAGLLDTGAQVFSSPANGATFVVADGSNPYSVKSARRMQGLAMQQGAHIGGAVVFGSETCPDFSGLPTVCMPRFDGDWAPLVAAVPADIQAAAQSTDLPKSVVIDQGAKEVRIYLPGFLKSEVRAATPHPHHAHARRRLQLATGRAHPTCSPVAQCPVRPGCYKDLIATSPRSS